MDSRHQLYAAPHQWLDLVRDAHDKLGHKGFYSTRCTLLDRFWWPSLEQNVKWYVETCHQCQLRQTTKVRIPPTVDTPAVMTFPPFPLPHTYYRPSSPNPVRIPCFISHVTFPSTVTLLFIITCRRGSSSSLSRTLTHYAYPLISNALYDTSTRYDRPFPGLSCI